MNNEERHWLNNALRHGGSFVKEFAKTCFYADDYNFAILRPALTELRAKYPKYSEMKEAE